jgi:hypothetical protein
MLGRPPVDVSGQPRELQKRLPRFTSPQGVAQLRDAALDWVKGLGSYKIFLVGDRHDDHLA